MSILQIIQQYYNEIKSTNMLDASVLVQRSTKSAQTTHATACTLAQM